MQSTINSITMGRWLFITLLHFSIWCGCHSTVCEICICSNTDNSRTVDCREKRLETQNTLEFDLMMFDEEKNLNNLILSENGIFSLAVDTFKNLKNLKFLDLSSNGIGNIPRDSFGDLINIEELDLSNNYLSILEEYELENLSTLKKLNLSINLFEELQQGIGEILLNLTHLDISHNKLRILTNGSLKLLTHLQYLDVSHNKIASLGIDNLVHLDQLETLRINNNLLVTLSPDELPQSIKYLYAGYNMVATMPSSLSQLEILSVEHNLISEIDTEAQFSQLKKMDISNNAFTDFPMAKLDKLETLDISSNKLSAIPSSLTVDNFPVLSTIFIGDNPIRELKFPGNLLLRNLVVKSFNLLEKVEQDAFSGIKNYPDECLHLTISSNKKLQFIHEHSLDNLNICSLDLSYNKLTTIPRKLLYAEKTLKIHGNINVQGNPFNCDCTLQWMLSDLVKEIYVRNSTLLDDLRCATPPELADKRMVHWYNWQEQVLCDKSPILLSKIRVETAGIMSVNVGAIKLESSTGMLAVVVGAAVVLSVLVIIGIVLAQKVVRQRSRRNRRF
ncbi:leucine-rich repeat-containing G-protein coupled receptor 5-like [Cephus cinctus]|uniref:Leucine-rich repeat-containing G-protein coupled receptor 5-like n=1 Tax=Cephus cinctus TaxID=211228 RepID=A0AAJ7FDG1_CEPCN|nr:leucine-rich repeat-containing G-protein coupled receptor 5-like [Cephus cinctus]